MRYIFLLLTLVVHASRADVPAYLVGDLEPGPYAVGYRVDNKLDYSRTYRLTRDGERNLSRQQGVRPMPISIWYPAEAAGDPEFMQFREYVYVDYAKESQQAVSTDAEIRDAEKKFFDTEIWTGTPNVERMRAVLDTPTTAIKNAPAVAGKFPLILYSPREHRGSLMNTVLLEYLASHGYVVAAIPNKSRHPASNDIVTHHRASAEDIRFLKRYTQNLDNVDPEHIGMIGYGIGVLMMMDAALDHERSLNGYPVDALVSLAGALGSIKGPEQFTRLPARLPVTAVDIPFMHMTCGGEDLCNEQEVYDKAISAQMENADAWFLKFASLDELGFSSFFIKVFYESVEESGDFNIGSIHRSYTVMSRYALAMMDAWLKDSVAARGSLNRTLDETGLEDILTYIDTVKRSPGNE